MNLLPDNTAIKTVYIGGGTPSLLNENQLKMLSNKIRQFINSFDDIEFSIELNPDDVNEQLLQVLEDCGINRISCGIQSMNDKSLSAVNRRTDTKLNQKAIDNFNTFWNKKLSLDLIAGLPYETEKTFKNGLKSVINAHPDHISLYTLTVEEGTLLFDQIEKNEIDYDFDFNDELWLTGKNMLEKSGYKQYEVSNFSKTGYECQHNLTYWKHLDYLGIGSGATGTVYNENGSGFRWTNTNDIQKYQDFWCNDLNVLDSIPQELQIIENIDKENSIFEFFMMGLRTKDGVSSKNYENIFHEKMPEVFTKLISEWNKKGLADIKSFDGEMNYSLTSKGLLFLNKFLEDLDL